MRGGERALKEEVWKRAANGNYNLWNSTYERTYGTTY
jgi:hypothetical protein